VTALIGAMGAPGRMPPRMSPAGPPAATRLLHDFAAASAPDHLAWQGWTAEMRLPVIWAAGFCWRCLVLGGVSVRRQWQDERAGPGRQGGVVGVVAMRVSMRLFCACEVTVG